MTFDTILFTLFMLALICCCPPLAVVILVLTLGIYLAGANDGRWE